MRASALSYRTTGKAEIASIPLKPLLRGELRLKTRYSAISRGTESLVFLGKVPQSEWQRMRCPHMAGEFSFPVSYGYSCVAEVKSVGFDVQGFEPGDRVFVMHPHQNVLQLDASCCHLLPDQMSDKLALLIPNMETALNAVWDAEMHGGENVAVIGSGVVGLLTAHAIAWISGARPVVYDVNEKKADLVHSLGFEFRLPKETAIDAFDVLFHTSASSSGLQCALDLAAFEAKIIEMSWYGSNPVSVELGGAFHSRRLKLISSQVGHVAPAKRNSVDFRKRVQAAMKLLDCNKLEMLLEPEIAFQQLPDHLDAIFAQDSGVMCQVVAY